MAGILNNKERILDTIVTDEGRRQVPLGKLKIEFVSFSDRNSFYQKDVISGSDDASNRIYFEASSMPQDQITFESDDSGFLIPFKGGSTQLLGSKILSGSGSKSLSAITGSEFSSLVQNLLTSSIENFKNLRIIGTREILNEGKKFTIRPKGGIFTITDDIPFGRNDITAVNVNDSENLFQDEQLSHSDNFLYLVPENMPTAEDPTGSPLGKYPKLDQENLSVDDLLLKLKKKEKLTVMFEESSSDINIITQVFESSPTDLKKLDVIDFGEFFVDDERSNKRIFFVGKVFDDDFSMKTFVNLFTLVFE